MLTVPSAIYRAVSPYAQVSGVPDPLWELIAYQESSFNPTVVSADGTSYGLFQLLVGGGQGDTALYSLVGHRAPYSRIELDLLLDAGTNAKYAMPSISSTWNKYKATFTNTLNWWLKFCADSGHPGVGASTSDPVVQSYARTIMANYSAGLFGNIGGAVAPVPSGPTTQNIAPTTPGKKAWYKFVRVDNIGVPDPFGGFPKPDSNVQVPAMYPITALLPGVVTGITHGVSYGAVLTIKFDTPPQENPKAQYYFYEHLNSIAPGITIGTHVYSSQLVAYNGSESAEGAQKVPLGFGLYAGPVYGEGAGWAITQAAITTTYNPVNLLDHARDGTLAGLIDPETGGLSNSPVLTTDISGESGTISGGNQTYTTLLSQVHSTLISNPGFKGMALSVDEAEQFPGWIDLTSTYNVGGFSLPDPVGIIRSVGATLVDNFIPFLIRSGIVSLGFILLLLLLYKAVMDSGVLEGAESIAPLLV